jgi:hypothetical protein
MRVLLQMICSVYLIQIALSFTPNTSWGYNTGFMAVTKQGIRVWGAIGLGNTELMAITNAKEIWSNIGAYAMLRSDGSIYTFGACSAGGCGYTGNGANNDR